MGLKTIIFTVAGFIALVFGAVGMFFPVWPTTPFVLVAAACFSGVPRLRKKLICAPFFGEYIKSYQMKTGLRKSTVIKSLVFLWGMLLISAFLIKSGWIALILVLIGVAVTVHILMIARSKKN